MSSTEPILDHLEQSRSRTSRMLAVGQKNPRTGEAGDVSPLARDLGGRKFQLAAQKMRILDGTRLGNVVPGKGPQIGGDIQSRYQHVDQLLHLAPKTGKPGSAWSRVDMIFPRSGSVEGPHTPEEPGSFRQGSVIPRMSTFPKPGQSPQTFLEQAALETPASKPPASRTAPQPARLSPRDRLFTSVQEITPAEKGDKNSSESQSRAAPGPSAPASQSSSKATVQRELEPSAPHQPAQQTESRQPAPESGPKSEKLAPPSDRPASQQVSRQLEPEATPSESRESPRYTGEQAPARPATTEKKLPEVPEATQASRKTPSQPTPARSEPLKPLPVARPVASRPSENRLPQARPVKAERTARPPQITRLVIPPAVYPQPSSATEEQIKEAEKPAEARPVLPENKISPTEKPAEARPVLLENKVSPTEKPAEARPVPLESKAEPAEQVKSEPSRASVQKPSEPQPAPEELRKAVEKPAPGQPQQPEPKAEKPEMPLAKPVRASQTEARRLEPPTQVETGPREKKLPQAQPSQTGEAETPAARTTRAIESVQPPLPVAQPVRKPKPAEAETARLPVAKAVKLPSQARPARADSQIGSQTRTGGAISQPPAAASAGSARGTVQRQVDSKPTPPASSKGPGQATSAPQATGKVPVNQTVTPPSSQAVESGRTSETSPVKPVQGPLQQHLEYRQQAPGELRSIQAAGKLITPPANPAMNKPATPLVPPGKYLPPEPGAVAGNTPPQGAGRNQLSYTQPQVEGPQAVEKATPRTSAPSFSALLPAAMTPSGSSEPPARTATPRFELANTTPAPAPARTSPSRPAETRPFSMPPASLELAFPARIPEPGLASGITPAVSTKPVMPAPQPVISGTDSSNTIQRLWEEHTDMDEGQEDTQGVEQSGEDLDELAEKILPLVKHLMALELERTGGRFK